MDKQKALEFTKERIEGITTAIYETESQRKISKETLGYLKFIEKILEE